MYFAHNSRRSLLADLEGAGAWADRDIGAKISFRVMREETLSRLMKPALLRPRINTLLKTIVVDFGN